MGKKSTLTAEQRTQPVLRLLSKEELRPGLVRTLGTLLERACARRRGGERDVCAAANPEQFTSCVVCSAERPAIGQSEDT